MPLKKGEETFKQESERIGRQSASKRAAAEDWDKTRSHRKNNKDGYWTKANKMADHNDTKSAPGTAKRKRNAAKATKGALGRLK